MEPWLIAVIVVAAVVALIIVWVLSQFISLWIQALVSGARVRFVDLVMMRFRKVDPKVIVFNRVSAKKAGLELSTDFLESHSLPVAASRTSSGR